MQINKVKVPTGALIGGFVGDAMNVAGGIGTFQKSQEEGDNFGISVAKSVIEFGAGEIFYGAMANAGGIAGMLKGGIAMAAVTTGANLAAKHMENTATKLGEASKNLTALGSGHFNMTQTGYTMRQRSLNAIRSNGANINSAFGNEARNYYLGL